MNAALLATLVHKVYLNGRVVMLLQIKNVGVAMVATGEDLARVR